MFHYITYFIQKFKYLGVLNKIIAVYFENYRLKYNVRAERWGVGY